MDKLVNVIPDSLLLIVPVHAHQDGSLIINVIQLVLPILIQPQMLQELISVNVIPDIL